MTRLLFAAIGLGLAQPGPPAAAEPDSLAIRRLDVTAFPTVRAWVRFGAGPGLAVFRLAATDLAAEVDLGPGGVEDVRATLGPPRLVILALPGSGDPGTVRSRLNRAGAEVTTRAAAGDRLIVVVPGVGGPATFGAGHPRQVLAAARRSLTDSTLPGGWDVIDRAASLAVSEDAVFLVVLPPSTRVTRVPGLGRLGRTTSGPRSELIVAGGAGGALRSETLARIGALDAGGDVEAAVRRALMVGPADSALDEVSLSLPDAADGTQLTLKLRLRPTIAGVDPAALEAVMPFQALRPGRVLVTSSPTPSGRPNPAMLGVIVSLGVAGLSLVGLLAARRTRAG